MGAGGGLFDPRKARLHVVLGRAGSDLRDEARLVLNIVVVGPGKVLHEGEFVRVSSISGEGRDE